MDFDSRHLFCLLLSKRRTPSPDQELFWMMVLNIKRRLGRPVWSCSQGMDPTGWSISSPRRSSLHHLHPPYLGWGSPSCTGMWLTISPSANSIVHLTVNCSSLDQHQAPGSFLAKGHPVGSSMVGSFGVSLPELLPWLHPTALRFTTSFLALSQLTVDTTPPDFLLPTKASNLPRQILKWFQFQS